MIRNLNKPVAESFLNSELKSQKILHRKRNNLVFFENVCKIKHCYGNVVISITAYLFSCLISLSPLCLFLQGFRFCFWLEVF